MKENTKYFLIHLPVCGIFAITAAAAVWLFTAVSNYTTYPTAVKVYSVGWFAACLLSFYCGLRLVPRSPGIIFSFAGTVAFAILCAMPLGALLNRQWLLGVIQTLPAIFFLAAWAAVAIASYKSDNKRIRISSWAWLTIFVLLLSSWCVFHVAQTTLHRHRNQHIAAAREKTLQLVEQLNAHKNEHGRYPETLAELPDAEMTATLSYRNKHIKYSGDGENFVLTFEDPMLGGQKAFSYDTEQGGWFPKDPKETYDDAPCHMFLSYLRR